MGSVTTVSQLFMSLANLEPPPPAPQSTTKRVSSSLPTNILFRLTDPSSTAARTAFLTLHFLFPHDLLPALDLLDKDLVSCFVNHFSSTPFTAVKPSAALEREVWYVQSASALTEVQTSSSTSGRFRNALRSKATQTFYEVRLDSWNCTCAAFAFNSFILSSTAGNVDRRIINDGAREGGFSFGGTAATDGPVPICKHILAAALARCLPRFAVPLGRDGRDWRRSIRAEEAAGWGGGWGTRG